MQARPLVLSTHIEYDVPTVRSEGLPVAGAGLAVVNVVSILTCQIVPGITNWTAQLLFVMTVPVVPVAFAHAMPTIAGAVAEDIMTILPDDNMTGMPARKDCEVPSANQ